MANVRTVLAQKERQLERVRREIAALVRVIPLLEEKGPTAPAAISRMEKTRAACRNTTESADRGMAELETYYPFVGRKLGRR